MISFNKIMAYCTERFSSSFLLQGKQRKSASAGARQISLRKTKLQESMLITVKIHLYLMKRIFNLLLFALP